MTAITALLHTFDNALQIGRCLETLHPCDEILIVDRGSRDETVRIAKEYGARVVHFSGQNPPGQYFTLAESDWILCLEPCESLTEGLAASLYELKCGAPSNSNFSLNIRLRQETNEGWIDRSEPQTRLIAKKSARTDRAFTKEWPPACDAAAKALEGYLLRFASEK